MKRRMISRIVLALLVCGISVFSGSVLYKKVTTTSFHGDETGWISSGLFYADLFRRGDMVPRHWECRQCGGWGSRYNPHAGQLLLGLPLVGRYWPEGRGFFAFYDFSRSLAENQEQGRVPPDGLLFSSRRVSAFFGILCCVLAVFIGQALGNVWIGAGTAVLLTQNHLFVQCATRAMTDIYYIFFLLCACLVFALMDRFPRKRMFALAGIFCGLAASVKIVGLPILLLLLVFFLVHEIVQGRSRARQSAGKAGIFFFSALGIVYLLNPFFWSRETFLWFPQMFLAWDAGFKSAISVDPDLALGSAASWPEMVFGSSSLLSERIQGILQVFPFQRIAEFHQALGMWSQCGQFKFSWVLLWGGIICSGVACGVSLWRKQLAWGNVLLFFFMSNYLFVLTFMQINWDRYYLPTVVAGQFLVAYFICQVASFVWGRGLHKKVFLWKARISVKGS